MSKPRLLLACILIIAPAASSQGAPLDSPGTVYIDGVPCNRACQSYMAWSRHVLSQQAAPLSPQPRTSQISQPSSKTKTQRATTMRASAPSKGAPARVAKNAAPKQDEPRPSSDHDPQLNREEAATADKPGTPAASSSPSAVETGQARDQAMTSPTEDDAVTATQTPAPDKQATGNTEPSNAPAADSGAGADTTAAVSPDERDERVAILLVSPEIKSISDLANKVIAIDEPPSGYSVADLKSAIVAAGAADVQLSEDQKIALVRVINGDVQAAVVTVLSSKTADAWNAGVRGFNVLRLPIPSPSKAKPG